MCLFSSIYSKGRRHAFARLVWFILLWSDLVPAFPNLRDDDVCVLLILLYYDMIHCVATLTLRWVFALYDRYRIALPLVIVRLLPHLLLVVCLRCTFCCGGVVLRCCCCWRWLPPFVRALPLIELRCLLVRALFIAAFCSRCCCPLFYARYFRCDFSR